MHAAGPPGDAPPPGLPAHDADSARALLRALHEGRLSRAAVARDFARRIEAARGSHAFTWHDPMALLAEAAAADARARRRDGTERLLDGLPVAVKDNIDTPVFPTTAGSRVLPERIAPLAAPVWQRLADQGALLLGKTNMDELGAGGTSRNPRFGDVANPLAPGHTAGGSSGGSAAALAAGLAPLALGTDNSGSLRIPASFCGVAGFRPTTGTYPGAGIAPLTRAFDTPGPMARSVADLVLLHQAVTGEHVQACTHPPVLARVQGRMAGPLHPALAAAHDAVLARWQAAGVRLVPIDLDDLAVEAIALQKVVGAASRLADLSADLAARGQPLPPHELQTRIATPAARALFTPPAPDAPAAAPALARLAVLADALRERLARAGAPLLLHASTLQPPARLDAGDAVFATNYYGDNARLAPALSLAACSFPCARDARGRPIAGANLEVAGPAGLDARVLAACLWLERH
ncbi:MAG: hypothetical protein KA795_01965 [Burkholderiaceae bacterium]|nr:hypothetical protein [Burkholderiaceae bacterium]